MGFFACNIFCFMGLRGNRGRGGVKGAQTLYRALKRNLGGDGWAGGDWA